MVKRAEGADPPTEEPSQENRQHHRNQGPQQACIEDTGGQHGAEGDQRIELKQPVDGPAAQLPPFLAEGAYDTEPEEKEHEENLAYSSYRLDSHSGINRLTPGLG
jgi:hypothetical protein